jgi:hypothetical protein
MKDRINDDAIAGCLIKDLEWESPDERTAELVDCDWIEFGMSLNRKHARLYATQEILTQPRLASLVPTIGVSDVLLGF